MRICQNCQTEVQDTFKFCPNCGLDLINPIICNNCNYENESNSKFCQECGDPLFDKFKKEKRKSVTDKITIDIPEPSKQGITIEFPYTTSQSFDFAVKEAEKFPTYEKFGQDKKAVYRVTIQENEFISLNDLLLQLKGWRKRTVYVNGEKVLWDTVFNYTYCYERKSSSFKPEYYCFGYENDWDFNLWGCFWAHMPFTENGQWFTFGKWLNNDGDWAFDKERIKHELLKKLYPVRYCPALNSELIQEIINALPDKINPKNNKNWKFVESYMETSDALIMKTNQFGYERTSYITGVCPNGKSFLADIRNKIKRRLPDFMDKF